MTFMAVVVVCWIEAGQFVCMEGHDTYGPYKSMQQCQERTYEMKLDILSMTPEVHVQSMQCRPGDNT